MSHGIQRVAVLGAGVMGAGIAAHLANAGIQSLLYDIVPSDAGDDPKARNSLALKGIAGIHKIKPNALYRKDGTALIQPANYDDHADLLATCDWIVEVVVERLDIKQKVFSWVEQHRAPGSIVSSNTSGLPLASMVQGMGDDMKRHFLVTHFFNPVRYMRLLEIVGGEHTDPTVIERLTRFGEDVLGKGIVVGKDTPNFVANRIGTFGMGSVFRHLANSDLSISDVDGIFGSPMGRAKSAIFRTADVVGLDTLVHVFGTVYDKCPDDEQRSAFAAPDYLLKLVEAGATGQKSGAGFYKKTRIDGKKAILALNLKTGEYEVQAKTRFKSVGAAKKAGTTAKATHALVWGDDPAADLAWKVTADTLVYSAHRIPEIADDVVNIDRAMRWGFAWEMGPFESWDAIGVRKSVERMQADGLDVPEWVVAMLAAGRESFYERNADGVLDYWTLDGQIETVPALGNTLMLSDLKAQDRRVARNVGASLFDLGDGVLGLEFHTKLNSLDEAIFDQYEAALDKLDAGEFDALVVGNQDLKAFCAGANILMILMGAMQKQWDTIDASIHRLQQLMQRAKYHSKPVVTAPFGLTLGGGCEVQMHSAATVAAGELYCGLVEVGVGLIPAGGGCKEMLVRYLGDIPEGVDYDPNPFVQRIFQHVGLGKISMSAEEARQMGYLRPTDRLVLNPDQLIHEAKRTALGLVAGGYKAPRQRTVRVPGAGGRAAIELFLYQMHEGGHATDHDLVVGGRLAHVLTGGDVPPGTVLTEQQLLDLEREAFLSLCGEAKTQARIQHMLQTNKPLRN